MTLAQRRQLDAEDIQAVEEILAEAAPPHSVLQILVGRSDDPHVRLPLPSRPQPVEPLRLDEPEQCDLDPLIDSADLVEQDGASTRLLELAGVGLPRPRERPLLVSEQLARHKLRGDGPQVHSHEGSSTARALAVHGLSSQVLARTSLPEQQDRDVRRCSLPDLPVDCLHGLAAPNHLLETGRLPLQIGRRGGRLPRPVLESQLDDGPQLVVRCGTLHILTGHRSDSRHRAPDVVSRRQEHDLRGRAPSADGLEQLDPVHAPAPECRARDQEHIVGILLEPVRHQVDARHPLNLDAGVGDQPLQAIGDLPLPVYRDDSGLGRH